jgi:single-stranded-DNA-specific exonuclease
VIPTYLDFVTLATAADIVPMNDENRVLMKLGLETLNRNPRPGVKALIESAGMTAGKISTGQIVFALAPRINAVGRLGDAMRAVKLLIADNETEGENLARVLEEENRNRRRIDEETFAQAQQMVDGFDDIGNLPAIVLHSPGWHPGVIGIVASRIVEKYYKPSIMLATVDGAVKGSARSVPGFDMYDALKMCEDTMIQFGGHKYAAGLTLDESRVDDFRQAFTAAVGQTMPEELKVPSVRIDVEIGLGNLSPRFLRILKEFAPFGPGNPRPVFLARNLEVIGKPRIVGRNHLRFRVRQEGVVFDAIGFDLGSLLPEILQTQGRNNLACVFSLDETEVYGPGGGWEGDPIPQLKIRDLRQETDAEGLSMQ